MHGPGHSSGDCRVLKEYSKKCASQWPHKENEAHSGGKTKRGKSVKCDINVKVVNIMEHHEPILKKNKGKTG